jgi:hypothetical protein
MSSKMEWVEHVDSWGQRCEPKPMSLLVFHLGNWSEVITVTPEGDAVVDLISYQGAEKLGIYLGSGMVLAATRAESKET